MQHVTDAPGDGSVAADALDLLQETGSTMSRKEEQVLVLVVQAPVKVEQLVLYVVIFQVGAVIFLVTETFLVVTVTFRIAVVQL
ncbi:hypothetical protein JG687_00004037 [Phytophthora cactorum]|uniref:Uncharacterized protein n=1 Tax=Phytophthora cactorum TaxID=29920 RepID=A0A8T1UPV5_9STRA|nr:hypothetical protein JG687_00004037 [Phytophthora cactorum]